MWPVLSRTYHIQLRAYSLFLKKWDVSVPQYELLVQVSRQDQISQKQLAENLSVSKGNITQLMNKMESLGYVQRRQEWKVKYVSLTEKGKELYNSISLEQKTYFTDQFKELTKKEQKQLIKLLRKLAPVQ